jgi:hypothetical protein
LTSSRGFFWFQDRSFITSCTASQSFVILHSVRVPTGVSVQDRDDSLVYARRKLPVVRWVSSVSCLGTPG